MFGEDMSACWLVLEADVGLAGYVYVDYTRDDLRY